VVLGAPLCRPMPPIGELFSELLKLPRLQLLLLKIKLSMSFENNSPYDLI